MVGFPIRVRFHRHIQRRFVGQLPGYFYRDMKPDRGFSLLGISIAQTAGAEDEVVA